MRNDGSGVPDLWTVYLSSDDAEKTCELVNQRRPGPRGAMAVGDLGTMAFVGPDGAAVGIWQPGEHKGFATSPRPTPRAGSRLSP